MHQGWSSPKLGSYKRCPLNTLGFTAPNKEPLMCAIIFAAKELNVQWKVGFDPFVQWTGREDKIEKIWVREGITFRT